MKAIFKTENLCKKYGSTTVLNNINMEVPEGSIYGFVGKNGAGKTTLIRLLCGLQKPSDGSFEIFGIKNTDPALVKERHRMGAIVECPAIYSSMNAVDNLKQQYLNLGLPGYDGIPELLKLVGLENTGSKKARNFSLGMRQRLAIAVALCGNPDFIVLDEPINGLDPQGIVEIRELIIKLNKEQGITILISSHILDELSKIATHYGFIDKGRIVREMSAEQLNAQCRKSLRIKVSDTEIMSRVLDTMGIEYKLADDRKADLYGEVKLSDVAVKLSEAGCDVLTMEEHDESLEGFFLSLIGGEAHA